MIPSRRLVLLAGGLLALGLAALGGGLCLVGALFLVAVRSRAHPVVEWHPERDTMS
jgi:hypothetical protein